MRTVFGDYLRCLRKRKKFKLRQVADHMGWSPSYIHDIESGRRKPPSVEKYV